MTQQLNLWNPWLHPEILILLRQLKPSKRPNYLASQPFESVVYRIYGPLLPLALGPQGDKYDGCISSGIHPLEEFGVFFFEHGDEILLGFCQGTSEDNVWRET